jgi:hypothetical protein
VTLLTDVFLNIIPQTEKDSGTTTLLIFTQIKALLRSETILDLTKFKTEFSKSEVPQDLNETNFSNFRKKLFDF